MESLRTTLWNERQTLLSPIENELKQLKAFYALVRFCEDLQRLTWRYNQYADIARTHRRWRLNRNRNNSLDLRQKQLVDKAMAFHQQVYVVVSSLGALLNQFKDIAVPAYTSGDAVASTESLLSELQQRHFQEHAELQLDLDRIGNAT